MKTYNPVWLDNDSWIPANPTLETKINPAMRDSVMTPREMPIPIQRQRWCFNHSTGLLESPFMLPGVEATELNEILVKAWKNHGRDGVKGVVLYLDPNSKLFDDCYPTLVHYKFERRGDLEIPAVRQLVFVGPPVKWKE